jgi:hypothetical protein
MEQATQTETIQWEPVETLTQVIIQPVPAVIQHQAPDVKTKLPVILQKILTGKILSEIWIIRKAIIRKLNTDKKADVPEYRGIFFV